MIVGLALCLLLVFASSSSAVPLVQDYFDRTGQSEVVVAPLTVFGGSTTTQRWSGLIEVIASGTGVNVPADYYHEDSFYPFDPIDQSVQGPGNLPPQGLRLSFTGCAASFECGAPRISDFFTFVEGIGFVAPPTQDTIESFLTVIPYSPDHIYHFVIDIGAAPHFLTLGEGDGGVFDNSGQFTVQLFAVTAIPEPSSLLLFGTGALGLVFHGLTWTKPRH